MLDESLFDDPDRLTTEDINGLLRASAAAGAQCRSTVEAARDLGVEALADVRPRALVLLRRPGDGGSALRVLAALLSASCPVPVVHSDTLPSWVGPLDVVFAHSDDPGDTVLAESIDRAGNRGSHLLLTAAPDGPVAAAAAGKAMLLPPRVPVPPGFGFVRALTAGLVLTGVLGLTHTDVSAVADGLDLEAERGNPWNDTLVNPAKSLALRLADRSPLLWGVDAVATAVAGYAARALAAHACLIADAADYHDALLRPALQRAAVGAASGADIFADPDDPDTHGNLFRLFVLAVGADKHVGALRARARERYPGADVVAPGDELGDAGSDVTACAAVLALRFELAALYLGLTSGILGQAGGGHPGVFTPA